MTPNQTMEQTTTSLAVPPSIACAPNTALIRVTGEDARHFLHGQFTQKIENLAGRTTLAGYCSPKGRLLAVLRAWLPGDAVMLALPAVFSSACICMCCAPKSLSKLLTPHLPC